MNFSVNLRSVNDVRDFVKMLTCDFSMSNFDAFSSKNSRGVVDAKSILGVMQLNLTEPIVVEMIPGCANDCSRFSNAVRRFQ